MGAWPRSLRPLFSNLSKTPHVAVFSFPALFRIRSLISSRKPENFEL
jgi:hypothetical protein